MAKVAFFVGKGGLKPKDPFGEFSFSLSCEWKKSRGERLTG